MAVQRRRHPQEEIPHSDSIGPCKKAQYAVLEVPPLLRDSLEILASDHPLSDE